jgi:S1-C subfamily serine protease
MKVLLFFICTSLLPVIATAQTDIASLSRAIVYLEMIHPVREDVGTNHYEVCYRLPGQTNLIPKTQTSAGTAFLVLHHKRPYVITAAHVVGDPNDPGTLHLFDTNSLRRDVPLQLIQQLLPGAKWFIHPQADVAVHPCISFNNQFIANLNLAEDFISTNAVPLLTPIVALGFPLQLGTFNNKISPIATECKTSSWATTVPNENPNLEFILLDKALAQGYSGAPIITRENIIDVPGFHAGGGPVFIIGICRSELGDILGGKHAVIIPSSYILEVFQQPKFLEYENNLPK